jgi:hypothetical protein
MLAKTIHNVMEHHEYNGVTVALLVPPINNHMITLYPTMKWIVMKTIFGELKPQSIRCTYLHILAHTCLHLHSMLRLAQWLETFPSISIDRSEQLLDTTRHLLDEIDIFVITSTHRIVTHQ